MFNWWLSKEKVNYYFAISLSGFQKAILIRYRKNVLNLMCLRILNCFFYTFHLEKSNNKNLLAKMETWIAVRLKLLSLQNKCQMAGILILFYRFSTFTNEQKSFFFLSLSRFFSHCKARIIFYWNARTMAFNHLNNITPFITIRDGEFQRNDKLQWKTATNTVSDVK